MLRTGLWCTALLAGMVAWLAPSHARAAEGDDLAAVEGPSALRFVQGLRERGYFDLAVDYLEQLRQAPGTPADLKVVIDYEMGRSLLEQASRSADLERRRDQLDQARKRLEVFTREHPKHPLVPEALVQMARLLLERGDVAMIQGGELKEPAEKQAKLVEARGSFQQARKAYADAEPTLKAAFDAFPKFIPDGDPRKPQRERALVALMEDRLQKALVDYKEAQTYPMGSKERNELLDRGVEAFKKVYEEHRTQLAGLYARMWQGKCYEEKGELGPAMGIYNELMDHPDPRLRPLQRQVGYFRIIVIGKRKEYTLAVDEAARWLQSYPDARRSEEGPGVLFELAKNLIAQLDTLKGAEHDAALKRATDALSEVVRFYSPYKLEALALLQKYRPKATVNATLPANLTFDDAMAQAEAAISSQDWTHAIALLKAAIRRADPSKEPDREKRVKAVDNLNRARQSLAFCYYSTDRYYEAAVLADHIARHYPDWSMAPKAANLGMAAFINAYNKYVLRDRKADLDNLIDLSRYTAETWPDTDEGDTARIQLGEIYLGEGHYPEAVKWYNAVRTSSPRHPEAQARAGTAHWRQSLLLRNEGKTSEADAEVKAAVDDLKIALKARQDAGAPPTDPSLIGNACDLAEVYLATERAKDALALLDPMARATSGSTPTGAAVPVVSHLLATQLRAYIGTGQVEAALANMKRLEAIGGSANTLTRLYYELGVLLKKEMEALQARGDQGGYQRTQDAYMKFLQALVASKAGQTYESLEWAGEAMLDLSQSAHDQAEGLRIRRRVNEARKTTEVARQLAGEAATIFQRVLDTYSKDATFQKNPNAEKLLFRTRLRLAGALRNQQAFDKADALITSLTEQNKGLLEPLMEKGLLLEDMAEAGQGKWAEAYTFWTRLAQRLNRASRPRPEFYEVSYHVAYVLYKEGQKAEARKSLRSVMRLHPTVGTPEIKAKYESLLKQVESS